MSSSKSDEPYEMLLYLKEKYLKTNSKKGIIKLQNKEISFKKWLLFILVFPFIFPVICLLIGCINNNIKSLNFYEMLSAIYHSGAYLFIVTTIMISSVFDFETTRDKFFYATVLVLFLYFSADFYPSTLNIKDGLENIYNLEDNAIRFFLITGIGVAFLITEKKLRRK